MSCKTKDIEQDGAEPVAVTVWGYKGESAFKYPRSGKRQSVV